jgi:ribosomal-protein-alanine N-acetyltransferase
MSEIVHLQLARLAEARAIAAMSRDLIENGLGWSWTPARVARQILCRDTAVVVARVHSGMAGFGIMYFRQEIAHLNLFAVARSRRRRGIGTRLLAWLEESAMVAGIATIELEVRISNREGRAFYKSAGYEEVAVLPGYYRGREDALQMARFLRVSEALSGLFTRTELAPDRT